MRKGLFDSKKCIALFSYNIFDIKFGDNLYVKKYFGNCSKMKILNDREILLKKGKYYISFDSYAKTNKMIELISIAFCIGDIIEQKSLILSNTFCGCANLTSNMILCLDKDGIFSIKNLTIDYVDFYRVRLNIFKI